MTTFLLIVMPLVFFAIGVSVYTVMKWKGNAGDFDDV